MTKVQSIERAFLLLDQIAQSEMGATELAEQVNLPKSTVSRLLSTLVALGAAERVHPKGVYRIGPRVRNMYGEQGIVSSLIARSRPHLRLLAEEIGEDAGLSVPDGHRVHYLAQEDAQNNVQVRDWTGTLLPLHVVPSGLVFLAHWPEQQINLYIEHGLEQFTAHTITHATQLQTRLAQTRKDGWAWVFEEFVEGINSVAAPVYDQDGRVLAALHVHAPAYRFPGDADREQIARQVLEAAQRVSKAMRR